MHCESTFPFLVLCATLSVLLQRDYGFMGDINIWPPMVKVGIYSSAISAAMSNLIGASRILYALSKDNLFGKSLSIVCLDLTLSQTITLKVQVHFMSIGMCKMSAGVKCLKLQVEVVLRSKWFDKFM